MEFGLLLLRPRHQSVRWCLLSYYYIQGGNLSSTISLYGTAILHGEIYISSLMKGKCLGQLIDMFVFSTIKNRHGDKRRVHSLN